MDREQAIRAAKIRDFFSKNYGATLTSVEKYMSQQDRFFSPLGELLGASLT